MNAPPRCLSLLFTLLLLAFACRTAPAAEPAAIPEDECLLEMTLPRGASVTIAGKNYGEQRSLRWRELKPGEWYPVKASVRFAGGETIDRDLFIRGGWRVPLAMLEPGKQRPELVVQSGHSKPISGVAWTNDMSRIVTGSQDNTAIVWDGHTGEKLRTLEGHTHTVSHVAITPDGSRVVTGSWDDTAIVWDGRTGEKLRILKGHQNSVYGVAITPDGSRVVTASGDHTAIVWDGRTGEKLRTLAAHTDEIKCVAITPDGSRVVTGSWDRTARVWDGRTGEKLRTLEGHIDNVNRVAITPDGSRVVTGSWDRTVIVWDGRTGEKLRTLDGHFRDGNGVAITPDGSRVLTGSGDNTAIVWDGHTGEMLRTFEGHTSTVAEVAITPDGSRVVTGSWDYTAIVWDGRMGEKLRTLEGHIGHVLCVAITPDGSRIITGSFDNTAIVWDGHTGAKLRTLEGHQFWVYGVAITPDGSRVVTGSWDHRAIVWDGRTGEKLRTLQGHTSQVSSVAVTADGSRVVTGSWDYTAIVWDGRTGEKLRTLDGHTNHVAITPDGSRVVTGSGDHTAMVWDGRTGEKLRTLRGHQNWVYGVAITPDGSRVVTGSGDHTAIVWDGRTGEKLRTLQGHSNQVSSVAVTADGSRVFTASADGTVGLWDTATGDLLCRLISLNAGKDWLVVTPEGLFDGSAGGREKVTFRIPGEEGVVPVDRFFQDFYRPGLLAALLRGERPMPEIEIGQALPPVVKITSPKGGEVQAGEVTLEVEAVDQGGGIGPLTLFHNGARMLGRGEQSREGNTLRRTFTVALLEGENRLRVSSASADGSWESEPAEIVLKFARPLDKPRLHLVAVGIGDYANTTLRLTCPPKDAQALSDLFTQRGRALYEQVNTRVVVDKEATKEAIVAALKEVGAASRPQDTFVVFLAGHGRMVGQRYYFVPREFASSTGGTIDADLRRQGLPSDEIGDYLAQAKALKRVLILDTCQSAGALGPVAATRSGFEFRGTVERLSRSQGVFTIAASGAGEQAFESNELGHGVLTYTLLAGLNAIDGGPLLDRHVQPSSEQGVVDIMEWFTFASGHVPRVTEKLFGEPQSVETSTQGQSFPVLPLR